MVGGVAERAAAAAAREAAVTEAAARQCEYCGL